MSTASFPLSQQVGGVDEEKKGGQKH